MQAVGLQAGGTMVELEHSPPEVAAVASAAVTGSALSPPVRGGKDLVDDATDLLAQASRNDKSECEACLSDLWAIS